MVVDDNEDLSELLCEILRHENYDVVSKINGAQAIDSLEAGEQYDLIMTDLIMPEKDGYDVLNYIKAQGLNVPTIAVSGGGMIAAANDVAGAVGGLASEVLCKPIKFDVLTNTVKKLVGS
tara:strand:+ start:5845 stop:6204 length:360 start_codon:yes stop_codon:yes gene_type:complete